MNHIRKREEGEATDEDATGQEFNICVLFTE